MSRYNNLQIPTAIRPDAKLRKKTIRMIGKYFASEDQVDGYNVIEVLPQQLTATEKDFLAGNSVKRAQVLDETVTDVKAILAPVFPNLSTLVIGNTEQVVTGLDTALAGLNVTVVVPNNLLSAYQAAYASAANLTFTSWQFQQVFTIPYIGESTLTAEYVELVASMAGGDIETVDKVIVPNDFTDYEAGALDEIFAQFENMTTLSVNGNEADVTGVVTPLERTFADSPWSNIQIIAQLGLGSALFALGDEKQDVGTDGVTRTMRIIDFDHYGNNEINCEQKEDINVVWNNAANTDDDNCINNYSISDVRTTYLPAALAAYSTSLQNAIGNTTYKVAKNGMGQTLLELTDKLFIGGEKEYTGETGNMIESEAAVLTQFSYYETNSNSKGRYYDVRSPRKNFTEICGTIGSAGGVGGGHYCADSVPMYPIFSIK